MLRESFEAGRKAEHRVQRGLRLKRDHFRHLRPALRQRAGFVEHDNIDPAGALQRLSVLDENAATRTDPGSDHDGRRRGKSE